ncbi:MAG: hypothetical protein GTN78_12185 [Gemmatimonadales bacterium]|nr:hypothetical protein [Gemmatimonadales bacterium]
MAADYGAIWEEQFDKQEEAVKALAKDEGYYGVFFPTEEPGVVDFVAGMAVRELPEVPAGLVAREVPEGEHAVAQCGIDAIGATWAFFDKQWMPPPPYQQDPTSACFEYFPPGVHSGEALVSIHVRVRPE